jgi:hypothetical protein
MDRFKGSDVCRRFCKTQGTRYFLSISFFFLPRAAFRGFFSACSFFFANAPQRQLLKVEWDPPPNEVPHILVLQWLNKVYRGGGRNTQKIMDAFAASMGFIADQQTVSYSLIPKKI